MGGKKGAGAAFCVMVKLFDNGPCDAEAVVGARAASDFVENNQAAVGGVVENICGFVHFDHESRIAAGEFVAGADAGENPIDESDPASLCRNLAAELRHEPT